MKTDEGAIRECAPLRLGSICSKVGKINKRTADVLQASLEHAVVRCRQTQGLLEGEAKKTGGKYSYSMHDSIALLNTHNKMPYRTRGIACYSDPPLSNAETRRLCRDPYWAELEVLGEGKRVFSYPDEFSQLKVLFFKACVYTAFLFSVST